MSIIISNITKDHIPHGVNEYVVCINRKEICRFEHFRTHDGLASCLRDAADAVEDYDRDKEAQMDLEEVIEAMQKINSKKDTPG